MKADLILSGCRKVKQTGPSNWIATCPAHEDRSPSMTVREFDDGRVLLHCFAGCSVESILGALGLKWDALFPDKPPQGDFKPPHRRPFPAADVLAAVADDCALICVTMANLGKPSVKITAEEYTEMFNAAGRVLEARRIALG